MVGTHVVSAGAGKQMRGLKRWMVLGPIALLHVTAAPPVGEPQDAVQRVHARNALWTRAEAALGGVCRTLEEGKAAIDLVRACIAKKQSDLGSLKKAISVR
jgi:hypothetical protein